MRGPRNEAERREGCQGQVRSRMRAGQGTRCEGDQGIARGGPTHVLLADDEHLGLADVLASENGVECRASVHNGSVGLERVEGCSAREPMRLSGQPTGPSEGGRDGAGRPLTTSLTRRPRARCRRRRVLGWRAGRGWRESGTWLVYSIQDGGRRGRGADGRQHERETPAPSATTQPVHLFHHSTRSQDPHLRTTGSRECTEVASQRLDR